MAAQSQYGWGHTIDFGPYRAEGFLSTDYLKIVGTLDVLGWWPSSLDGTVVADVGCFTGGITALLAHRGAEKVVAVDEVGPHLEQCRLVVNTFGMGDRVDLVHKSLFRLPGFLPAGSLDLILLSGVLYHLSDMLVGLYALRTLLKPGGTLIVETNAVHERPTLLRQFRKVLRRDVVAAHHSLRKGHVRNDGVRSGGDLPLLAVQMSGSGSAQRRRTIFPSRPQLAVCRHSRCRSPHRGRTHHGPRSGTPPLLLTDGSQQTHTGPSTETD